MIDFLFRKSLSWIWLYWLGVFDFPTPGTEAYVSVKNSFFIRKSEALKDPRFRLDPFNHIRNFYLHKRVYFAFVAIAIAFIHFRSRPGPLVVFSFALTMNQIVRKWKAPRPPLTYIIRGGTFQKIHIRNAWYSLWVEFHLPQNIPICQ